MIVELIDYTQDADEKIDRYAGICYGRYGPSKDLKRLKNCIAKGHTSVLEHAVFTFYIADVSRVLLAELTRHRIASYTVESTRYCDLKKGDAMDLVPSIRPISNKMLWFPELSVEKVVEVESIMEESVNASEKAYRELLEAGVEKEDARMVLPMGMKTKLIMTMNARELLNFFEQRCCSRAYWEISELADMMLKEVKSVAPVIFENAGCKCFYGGQCKEKNPCELWGKYKEKSN